MLFVASSMKWVHKIAFSTRLCLAFIPRAVRKWLDLDIQDKEWDYLLRIPTKCYMIFISQNYRILRLCMFWIFMNGKKLSADRVSHGFYTRPLIKVLKIASLNSHPWWDLGLVLQFFGPGERMSLYVSLIRKLIWFWEFFQINTASTGYLDLPKWPQNTVTDPKLPDYFLYFMELYVKEFNKWYGLKAEMKVIHTHPAIVFIFKCFLSFVQIK